MGSAYLTVFPPSQLFFFARPQVLEPGQLQHSPPFLCLLISDITAKARARAIIITRMMSIGFIGMLLSGSAKSKHDQAKYRSHSPGDAALPQNHENSPLSPQLPPDSGYGRHAGRVEKAEYE